MSNNDPIKLTLTIPVDGSGVVDIVGSKGDVAKMWQVAYGDQADLAAAIHTAAWELVNLEIAPPPRYESPAMPGKSDKDAKKAEKPKPAAAQPAEAAPADDDGEELDEAPDAGLEDEIRETGEATDAFLESEDEGPEPEEDFEEDPLETETESTDG